MPTTSSGPKSIPSGSSPGSASADKSVRKKLKDKAFAAKVDRGEIATGVELLGVDLSEHIQLVIDALKPHADELGIGPRKSA